MALTACTLDCPDACSLLVEQGVRGTRIRGNPEHPVTQGFTCRKIHRHLRRLSSGRRVRSPLLRQGAGWQEISWDAALDLCLRRLGPVLAEAPERVLHLQGNGSRGVMRTVVDRFFSSLGCSKTRGSLCDSAGIRASVLDFGALDHNDVRCLAGARNIVNWGKDLTRSSEHMGRLVQQARRAGAAAVAICPGGDGYQFSDRIVRIAPGTDRFLALAVLRELEDRGRIPPSGWRSCENASTFYELLRARGKEELAARCGAGPRDVAALADLYERGAATVIGWGVQRHPFGGQNVRFIDALAWLSGNVGAPDTGVYFNLSSLRNLNLSWLPEPPNSRGLRLPLLGDDLESASQRVEAAWISGCNIVNQAPDSKRLSELFSGLDFLVVVDAFMTDTAACADLVLPCTLMWEQEDVVGSSMHNFLQYAAPLFPPPVHARTDEWIARQLCERLGSGFTFPSRERCFRQSLGPPFPDIDLDGLKSRGFAEAPREPAAFASGTAHPGGLLHLPRNVDNEPQPDPDYPLRMLSLIRRDFIHSQILPEEHRLPPRITVNPNAPGVKGLDFDRRILLVSPLGRMEVDLVLDESVHPEALICRRGDWMRMGGGVNRLVAARSTDLGEGTDYYGQGVRLENAGD